MGSHHSSNAFAYTYIDTEASSFCPGTFVSGVVKILVEKPVYIGQMSILLTCSSKCMWSHDESDLDLLRHQERVLSKTQFNILRLEYQLSPGQYELPFNIQLPTDLVPSFKYEYRSNYSEIEYICEIVSDDNLYLESLKTIVWVNKLLHPSQAIGPVRNEATFNINSCCCFNRGKVEVKAFLNTNVASTTDEIFTTISIDNSMNRCALKKVTCSLHRLIRFKVTNHPHITSQIYTSLCAETVRDVRILPGEFDAPDIVINLNLNEYSGLWMMPTVETDLADCEYYIKLNLDFDTIMGFGIYEFTLPIELFNGKLILNNRLSEQPELQMAWNPTMLAVEPIQVEIFDHMNLEGDEQLSLINPGDYKALSDLKSHNSAVDLNHSNDLSKSEKVIYI
jgi:hypothetical protein